MNPKTPPQPAPGGVEHGGFWIRFAACAVDGFLIMLVWIPIGFIFINIFTVFLSFGVLTPDGANHMPTGDFIDMLKIFLAASAFGFAAYFIIFPCSVMQATPGKHAMGLKITDAAGNRLSVLRALGRYFAVLVSSLILFIGFIMIAFTDRKRGLHDMMAGTLVVRR